MAIPRMPLVAFTIAALLTGCFTGERPTFEDEVPAQPSTGDPNVDAVLERLDSVPVARFTAEYDVTTRFGNIESEAVVVQAADGRRSITINDVRFVIGDGTDATCDLTADECEASINDARVSDIGVTHEFYAASFAARLRADANRRVSDTQGYTEALAGQQITCVDVPLSGIVRSYCALDSGPLARYEGNDLLIALTAISDTPDESKFQTG
jgi:hypothetical protein